VLLLPKARAFSLLKSAQSGSGVHFTSHSVDTWNCLIGHLAAGA